MNDRNLYTSGMLPACYFCNVRETIIIEKDSMKKTLSAIAGICLCILFMGFRDIGHYPDKIWLHRCNSMEKLYEKYAAYPNIEVDVVFRNSRTFDVTHDIDTSFNLKLDAYFAYMKDRKGKIWLDIKNLTAENRLAALAGLDRLTRHFQIAKDRLIIESPSYESLELFTQEGYYTSYYVTYKEPCALTDKKVEDCIGELQRIVDGGSVCALSFPGCWYETIKEELDRSIDLLTWEHRTSQLQLLLSSSGRRMLSDPQLKVVLVKEKGSHHR